MASLSSTKKSNHIHGKVVCLFVEITPRLRFGPVQQIGLLSFVHCSIRNNITAYINTSFPTSKLNHASLDTEVGHTWCQFNKRIATHMRQAQCLRGFKTALKFDRWNTKVLQENLSDASNASKVFDCFEDTEGQFKRCGCLQWTATNCPPRGDKCFWLVWLEGGDKSNVPSNFSPPLALSNSGWKQGGTTASD